MAIAAEWKPSPYYSRGWWNPPTNIALHCTAATLASTLHTFTSPSSTRKVSAHYVVDGFTERIIQCVGLENRAHHALDANEFAIGIELVNNGAHLPVPERAYDLVAPLVAELCRTFNLAVNEDTVGPHYRWVATACPSGLEWQRVVAMAGGVEVPSEAEWRQHLADEANGATAVRNVLAQLAHAKHPEHILDPNVRAAMRKLDVAVAKMGRQAKAPPRRAGGARAGHGRGKSKDVED